MHVPSTNTHCFAALKRRALARINLRVANGHFSERALARVAGVSQPHTHHVLSGARQGSDDVVDRLCRAAAVLPTTVVDIDDLRAIKFAGNSGQKEAA